MYNVKIIRYYNGDVQTRVYTCLNRTNFKSTPNLDNYVINPFDGSRLRVLHSFDELDERKERSMIVSRTRALNTIYMLARGNEWEWFVTMTFDPCKVDRYNYADCGKKLSAWLKHCKKYNSPNFRYLIVPELHQDGAFHFHGLFANCEGLDFVESGKKDLKGRKIYNIGKYRLGWTTATKISNQEAVSKYLTKYVTKELIGRTKGKKHFWASRNLDKPEQETKLLDYADKQQLISNLLPDASFVKKVDYKINLTEHSVLYIDTLVNK